MGRISDDLSEEDSNSVQRFNWSKNNFGEIHISQGLDWAFPSLSHYGSCSYLNSELIYINLDSFGAEHITSTT